MSYEAKDRVILMKSIPSSNPPTGFVFVYVNTNGNLTIRNSDGVDEEVNNKSKQYSLLMS